MKNLITAMLAMFLFFFSASAETPHEYFSVGNPIKYCGEKYYFGWSAHPNDIYYLQEYLPKGETFERYNKMFTVSVIFWDREPLDVVNAKIAELEERKKTDIVTNYLVAENNGEYILEFIVSDGTPEALDCVEVDVHYYRQMTIDGKKASVLLFYSERAYGDDIIPFMKSIPDKRAQWYESMFELNLTPKMKK